MIQLVLGLLAAPYIMWQSGFETPPPEHYGPQPWVECWWPAVGQCNWLELASSTKTSYTASCDHTLSGTHWCYQSTKVHSGAQAYQAWVNNATTTSDVQRGYIMGDKFRTIGDTVDLPGPWVFSGYVWIDPIDFAQWPPPEVESTWAVIMSFSAHNYAETSPQLWSVSLRRGGLVSQWWWARPEAEWEVWPFGKWARLTVAFSDNPNDMRAIRTWVDGRLVQWGPYQMAMTNGAAKAGPHIGAFHPGAYVDNSIPKLNMYYDDLAFWHIDTPWTSDAEPDFVQPPPEPPPPEPSPQPSLELTCPGTVRCICE